MSSNVTMEFSQGFRITISCIFGLEMLFGFVSCLSVLLVYYNKRQIHTAANIFIANLALVDCCMSVAGIPLTLAKLGLEPRHSVIFCLCHEGLTSCLRNASITTLLLICYDRYRSITNPFRARITLERGKMALTILWISSALTFTLPFLEYASKESYISGQMSCIELFTDTNYTYFVRAYHFPLFFFASLITLSCYLRITQTALSRIKLHSFVVRTSLVIPLGSTLEERENASRIRTKEWKVAKITGAMLCSVCVLWFPYTIFTLIVYFMKPTNTLAKLEYVFLMLGYFNCTLNPILYAYTKQKFRNAFVNTFPKFPW